MKALATASPHEDPCRMRTQPSFGAARQFCHVHPPDAPRYMTRVATRHGPPRTTHHARLAINVVRPPAQPSPGRATPRSRTPGCRGSKNTATCRDVLLRPPMQSIGPLGFGLSRQTLPRRRGKSGQMSHSSLSPSRRPWSAARRAHGGGPSRVTAASGRGSGWWVIAP